ncbi:MAG: diguanylate cyclase [Thermodesulfobacteriota bacterium]|nr:diguanylate cyclase [Thermodesulfobacteriota bacterium]
MNNSFPILIAEDDLVSRKLLEKALIKGGYPVVSVKNGREAFSTLKKQFFPIVITDWLMPEMDGLELCRAIRNHDFPGYIFIILVTARDTSDDIIAGLDAGADDYITKPFKRPELIARLKAGRRILELERSLKTANEKIKVLSITDPLTGTYNRGYLIEHLPHEIARSKRYGHPISLIMCDIDHFKKINDSYGHQAGDRVLKYFVDCLKDVIRDGSDWIVRYGGEEFLIVLPKTGIEGSFQIADRLCSLISSRIFKVEDHKISITASFGVSHFYPSRKSEKCSLEILIKQADMYLYKAKKEGRNRVKGGFNEKDTGCG